MKPPIQLGDTFGLLTIVSSTPNRPPVWVCRCSCGQTKEVPGRYLASGGTRSCGCLVKANSGTRSHGLSKHGGYVSYKTARARLKADFQLPPFPEAWGALESTWTKGASLNRHDPRAPMTLDNVCWVIQGFAKSHNADAVAKVKAAAAAKHEAERVVNLARRLAEFEAKHGYRP